MNRFSDHYPTGRWEDEIELDEFERADGITHAEAIDAIRETHYCGDCDQMTCPVCQWESMRADSEATLDN